MNGTFKVLTESIPCGPTESICSTAIKLYLGVHNNGQLPFSIKTTHKNVLIDFAGLQISILCFFQNNEIILSDESVRVVKQSGGVDIPYQVHTMGIYLVIEAKNGLVLVWNKKTTVIIRLNSSFKVGKQVYMSLCECSCGHNFIQINTFSLHPRVKSVVCVEISMEIQKTISPPEAKNLWLMLLCLETVGKCHLSAQMCNFTKIPAFYIHTGRHGH